jgi:hypothetical protein
MAAHINTEEFLQQQLLSPEWVRDRGWSEALNTIDSWDRDAADACEAVLKIYEAEHDAQSARTWEKLVISMARDPHNLVVLHAQAKRALANLSLAAVPQETRAQRAATLLEEAKAKAAHVAEATRVAKAAKAAQAAQAAKAAQAAQAAKAAQVAQSVQAAQAIQAPQATHGVQPTSMGVEETVNLPRKGGITRAPLSYDEIRRLGPFLRALTGYVMIAYSIVSAALVVGWLLSPVVTYQFGFFSGAHVIGALFGITVTLFQWNTREDYPLAHWCLVLLFDAPFSGYITYSWVRVIAVTLFAPPEGGMTPNMWLSCVGIALAWGVISAKFGEALLIGFKPKR